MSDTVFYTVLSGTLVLVIGQLIKSFFIEPIIELHKLIGEIDYSLHFYADLYANPGVAKSELMDEAKNTIRQQASQLRAKAYAIRLFWLRKNVIEASDVLTRLSNSIHEGNAQLNIEDRNKIRKLLHIQN